MNISPMELEDECEIMIDCRFITKIDFGILVKTTLILHHEAEMEEEKGMKRGINP